MMQGLRGTAVTLAAAGLSGGVTTAKVRVVYLAQRIRISIILNFSCMPRGAEGEKLYFFVKEHHIKPHN
jgi:hypothetical protein